MYKKLIALLLALVMVCGLVACGNTAEAPAETNGAAEAPAETKDAENAPEKKDPVTITYHYTNGAGEQQYTEQVEEKLNELMHGLEGYEHISIDLVPYTYVDYATNFALAQANGDQIDLVSTFGLDFDALVKDGDIIALDDLMAAYPQVVSDIPEWIVSFGKVDGVRYYVPTYQQAYSPAYMFAPVEYFEMYYKATGKTRDDLAKILREGTVEERCDMFEEFYLAVVEGTGLTSKKMVHFNYPYHFFNIDEIDESYGKLVYIEGEEEPCYWPLTDEFKYAIKRANEWFKKGWINTPDTKNVYDFSDENSVAFGISQGAMSAANYAASKNTDTITFDAIPATDGYFISSKWAAGGHAIYADCEHPEEAMMIIELLMTEKCPEFYNTLVWGLEGIHWEMVDEEVGRIKTLEFDGIQGGADTTYCAWNFNNGNVFNAYINQAAVSDDYFDFIENVLHSGPDTDLSPYMGITWRFEDYSDILGQLKAVNAEYFMTLYTAEDFEASYAEYCAKLEAAGVNELMEGIIQQANAYVGK